MGNLIEIGTFTAAFMMIDLQIFEYFSNNLLMII